MLDVWLPLLICIAAGATWFRILRLRERALARVRETCAQHGLQLLDDSVALQRLRLRWRRGTLHALREYRFETSLGGHDRHTASITLLGDRIVGASLPARDEFASVPPSVNTDSAIHSPASDAAGRGNVVSIDRARRDRH